MLHTFVFFRLVVSALKDVDPERKCFRMVGGVLVERTVKDVLPALVNNREQVRIKKALKKYFWQGRK
jgi:chaperonin cofactor prefoldin